MFVVNLAGSYFLAGSSSNSQANYWVREFQNFENNKSRTDLSQSPALEQVLLFILFYFNLYF